MAAVCTTYVFTSASVRSFGTALAAVSILLETSHGRSDQIPADGTANAITSATFLGCCRRSHFRMGAQNQQDPRTLIPRSVDHICAEQNSPQHSQLPVSRQKAGQWSIGRCEPSVAGQPPLLRLVHNRNGI